MAVGSYTIEICYNYTVSESFDMYRFLDNQYIEDFDTRFTNID
jgi:hypothetical protein